MQTQSGFELIQSFLVVAEKLNFRRAAERLNIDQSALSRRIRKLEDMLGFALFERTTRDVSLTPAGRTFYDENVHLLTDYSRSVEKARLIADGKTGRLRIAFISLAAAKLMPQAVSLFMRSHPYVDIHLRYIHTRDQKLALANDEIDVGYMLGPIDVRQFRSILLKSDPLYAVMPPGHPLARKREVAPADLAGVDVILSSMSATYRQRLDELFSSAGVSLQYRLEAPNTLAIAGFLASGLGVTIYPKSIGGFLGADVELRPISHPDFLVQTSLVWRHASRSQALRNFVEVAKSIYPR